jgi:hypothetical protein
LSGKKVFRCKQRDKLLRRTLIIKKPSAGRLPRRMFMHITFGVTFNAIPLAVVTRPAWKMLAQQLTRRLERVLAADTAMTKLSQPTRAFNFCAETFMSAIIHLEARG